MQAAGCRRGKLFPSSKEARTPVGNGDWVEESTVVFVVTGVLDR